MGRGRKIAVDFVFVRVLFPLHSRNSSCVLCALRRISLLIRNEGVVDLSSSRMNEDISSLLTDFAWTRWKVRPFSLTVC